VKTNQSRERVIGFGGGHPSSRFSTVFSWEYSATVIVNFINGS